MTSDDKRASIHGNVAAYYGEKLAAHGPTARGVDWRDDQSHGLRHQQFQRLIADDADASISDLGCGYGDYLRFLRAAGHRGCYVGYDLSPAMVAAARELYGEDSDRMFQVGGRPERETDYVVASGIFNVKQDAADDDWESYIADTIDDMAASARRGFAFNLLTSWSDRERQRPDLYYADPAKWFNRCAERYGRRVAVLQDYGLYEFTLICRLS